MKLSVCIFVLSLQISVATEATKTWNEWVSEGTTLFGAGNYRDAAQAFQQALTAAESSGVPYHPLVIIISSLASAYSDAGQYSESEREWRHALDLVKKTEGPDSLNYAVLVAGLAVLPTQTGSREETITAIRKAIAVNGQRGSYRDLAWLRRCLAQILIQQKKYDEAEALLLDQQSNSAHLKETGPDLSIMSLNELGAIRYKQGRFADAAELFRELLPVLEATVDGEHPSLVVPLNNFATSLAKSLRLEDASGVYQRAAAICKNSQDADHPTCAVLFENYASVLRKLGRKREAKEMAVRARQIELAFVRRNGVGSVVTAAALRAGDK